MKNVFTYLLRFLGVLFAIALMIIVGCLVFEEEILVKGRDLIAKKLGTEIETHKLDLDPFSHFPKITLSMEDLSIADNRSKKLLGVESMELLFQPWNIFSDHLNIQTIVLSNGELNLFKTNDQWNFSFNDQQTNSNNDQLDLSQIELFNVSLNMVNRQGDLDVALKVNEFLGSVSMGAETSIVGYLEFIPERIKRDSLNLLSDQLITAQLNVSNAKDIWALKQMDIETNGVTGQIRGDIGEVLNIIGEIEIMDKAAVVELIPKAYHPAILNDAKYEFDLKGKSTNPSGKFSLKANDLKVDLIKKENIIKATGSVKASFLNDYQTECVFTYGKIVFADLAIDANSLDLKSLDGALGLRDLEMNYKEKAFRIDVDQIEAINGKFTSEEIEIELGESKLKIDGSLEQLANHYQLNGKLSSEKLVVKDFLELMQDSISSDESMNVDAVLEIAIEEMIYENWTGEAIQGDVIYENNAIQYDIALESFDGEIISKGKITEGEKMRVEARSSFNDLNVDELLDQLNNLGQTMINSETVDGNLSGHALIDFTLEEDMSIDKKKSNSKVALRLEKGRFQNFQLLEDFSKFIDVRDLRNVKFDRLTNFFEWRGDHLLIPVLFIKNNAASFLISGKHNLNNEFSYQMQINASEILAKKFGKKRRKSKRKGWWNMYYSLEGNPEAFEVISDKNKVQKSLKQSLLIKENIFNQLTAVFGYDEILDQLEEWKDIPEYDD